MASRQPLPPLRVPGVLAELAQLGSGVGHSFPPMGKGGDGAADGGGAMEEVAGVPQSLLDKLKDAESTHLDLSRDGLEISLK